MVGYAFGEPTLRTFRHGRASSRPSTSFLSEADRVKLAEVQGGLVLLRYGCLTLAGACTGRLFGFFAAGFLGVGADTVLGAAASSPAHGQASLRASIASVIPASLSRAGFLSR